jgi:4-hydroxy-3-polyprenylbenzoate decarboxylase
LRCLKIWENAKVETTKISMELTLAITGASGTIYAYRTLQLLAASGAVKTVNLIMSGTSVTVAQVEMGANLREPNAEKFNEWLGFAKDSKLIRFWKLDNLAAKPASGSNKQTGMIIVPCSMGTLGAIASGAGTNLIHRAADVTLKEKRKLILVPRETPYNQIHLENMLRLARNGAQILPASPGFYHRPKTIEELVDHLCFRILDQFDIPHSRKTQWTGDEVGE